MSAANGMRSWHRLMRHQKQDVPLRCPCGKSKQWLTPGEKSLLDHGRYVRCTCGQRMSLDRASLAQAAPKGCGWLVPVAVLIAVLIIAAIAIGVTWAWGWPTGPAALVGALGLGGATAVALIRLGVFTQLGVTR